MQIYTSYFAKVGNLPKDICTIAISLSCPVFYQGFKYKALAPSWDIIEEYKIERDVQRYTARYNDEILSRLNPMHVMGHFRQLSGGRDVCLLCYESPTDFCHRHIVAEWLEDALVAHQVYGFVQEYKFT